MKIKQVILLYKEHKNNLKAELERDYLRLSDELKNEYKRYLFCKRKNQETIRMKKGIDKSAEHQLILKRENYKVDAQKAEDRVQQIKSEMVDIEETISLISNNIYESRIEYIMDSTRVSFRQTIYNEEM